MHGINKPSSGGFIFEHDFIPDPSYYKINQLNGNYFIKNTDNIINSNTQTTTSLGGDSVQVQQNASNAQSSNTSQSISAQYHKRTDNNVSYDSINLYTNNSSTHNQQQGGFSNAWDGLQSTNNAQEDVLNSGEGISFQAGLSHKKSPYSISRLPSDIDLRYSLDAGSADNDQVKKTAFVSLVSPSQDVNYNRHYSRNGNDIKQHLTFGFGDIYTTLFGKTIGLGYRNRQPAISIKMQNNLDVNTHTQHNLVEDATTGAFIKNGYLSVNGLYTVINEQPALSFGKEFRKELASRYSKDLSVNFLVQAQFYHQQNTSDHSFQNIMRGYQKFVPDIVVNFSNYQFGAFQDNYGVRFTVSSDHPTFDQLVPSVDSSNSITSNRATYACKQPIKRKCILTCIIPASVQKIPLIITSI